MASLTILGSGPFTRLRANGEFTLDSFRSVRIADLELEMAGGKPLTFRQCGSVTLERCGVSKGDPSGIACAIESDRGTIVGSTLTGSGDESKPVLALDPNSRLLNGSTLIDHSVLAGSLVIGGRVPAKAPDPKTLATLPQLLASENLGPEPVGALHVRSSRIARLAVDQQALKSLGEKHGQAILRELSLTDTTVGGKDNLAVARRVLLNGGGLETGGEAGLLIGRTAVVSSIWGDAKTSLMIAARRVEGAANLIALFDPDGSEIPAP